MRCYLDMKQSVTFDPLDGVKLLADSHIIKKHVFFSIKRIYLSMAIGLVLVFQIHSCHFRCLSMHCRRPVTITV